MVQQAQERGREVQEGGGREEAGERREGGGRGRARSGRRDLLEGSDAPRAR